MKCPVDQATLLITERQGVEIDYCPECRGVWLDRGELDKLMDREADRYDEPRPARGSDRPPPRREEPKKKKKKTSFLSEIFESIGE